MDIKLQGGGPEGPVFCFYMRELQAVHLVVMAVCLALVLVYSLFDLEGQARLRAHGSANRQRLARAFGIFARAARDNASIGEAGF